MALGAFLRFYRITEIPLGLYPDEAMNGNNALEALHAPAPAGGFKVFYPENNGREGLFINLQAISVAAFGPTPWALRIVSTVIGTLTILGIYLVAKELFSVKNHNVQAPMTNKAPNPNDQKSSLFGNWDLDIGHSRGEIIALFSSFFLATSYWHLNFSRIGFRAIMLPLFAVFGMYFLLRGLRTRKALDLIFAGIFTGLGVHTYIAFRFMVFVFAVPVVYSLWQTKKTGGMASAFRAAALYAAAALIVLAPLGFYFFGHPEAFANRAGDVSIFSAEYPAKEFLISAGKTAGMFFIKGDCNWRHNFNCKPELNPLVAIFFIIGVIVSIRTSILYPLPSTLLFVWLIAMSLPAVLTREGIPHALRSIGILPPAMILAALGADRVYGAIGVWSARKKTKWPAKAVQIERIRRELGVLLIAGIMTVPLVTYRDYFMQWAEKPETYDAFDTSGAHTGEYLARLPRETKKYVVVNRSGTLVRGIPMPSQTVMYLTDTFREDARREKGFSYIVADNPESRRAAAAADFKPAGGERFVIAFIDGMDRDLIGEFRRRYPALKAQAPRDFVILQNYDQ